MHNVEDWSTRDVSKWLQRQGYKKYAKILCEDHKIDGKALLLLTECDILRCLPDEVGVYKIFIFLHHKLFFHF